MRASRSSPAGLAILAGMQSLFVLPQRPCCGCKGKQRARCQRRPKLTWNPCWRVKWTSHVDGVCQCSLIPLQRYMCYMCERAYVNIVHRYYRSYIFTTANPRRLHQQRLQNPISNKPSKLHNASCRAASSR